MASLLSGINFLVFHLLLASCSVVVAYDGKLLSRVCSGHLFGFGSTFAFAVDDIMQDLMSHTSEAPELDYYCHDTHGAVVFLERDITLYGHGVCLSSLDPHDCQECIKFAKSEMFKECTHSVGAKIQLKDCRLRYENYKFNNDW